MQTVPESHGRPSGRPKLTNEVQRLSSAIHIIPGRRVEWENAIGRLRRTLPRKTDLATLSDERFTQLIQAYNNTPRKCLGYRTPAEIFLDRVLHLKCGSTRFLV